MPCCIDRMRFSPRFSIREKKGKSFFFHFFYCQFFFLCVASAEPGRKAATRFLGRKKAKSNFDLAPISEVSRDLVNILGSYARYLIKIFESNLGITNLTFGIDDPLMWCANKRPTMHRPRKKKNLKKEKLEFKKFFF